MTFFVNYIFSIIARMFCSIVNELPWGKEHGSLPEHEVHEQQRLYPTFLVCVCKRPADNSVSLSLLAMKLIPSPNCFFVNIFKD